MKSFRPIVLAALFAAVSTAAWARPNPEPKPSGIVVHLFGPGSITSGVLPSFVGTKSNPGSPPPPAAAQVGGGAGHPAIEDVAGPAPQATTTAPGVATESDGPTMGQVLHQMFVTGDPNLKPGENLAPGRAAEHPAAVNP